MDGGGVMMARQTVDQSQLFSVLRIHSTASNTRRSACVQDVHPRCALPAAWRRRIAVRHETCRHFARWLADESGLFFPFHGVLI